jgi:hypothetical protein
MATLAPSPFDQSRKAILFGGLLAGTFDLTFACIYYGSLLGVMKSVAGGLLGGAAASQGGIPTALLGVLLHFLIAFIWAALFWIASRRMTLLISYAVPAGLLYGLVVFYGMNSVVLPLSALHTKAWPPSLEPLPIAMHMLTVGLPIALVARKF